MADVLASPPNFALPFSKDMCYPSHVPTADAALSALIACCPTILDDDRQFPEFSSESEPFDISNETPEDYDI